MPNLKPKETVLVSKLEKIFLVYFSTKGIGGKGKIPYKVGNKYVITIKLDPELVQQLDLIATNNKISRSEVIRRAILLYLGRYPTVVTKEL